MSTLTAVFKHKVRPDSIKKRMTATQILVLGFFAVICVGTLLLTLPISSQNHTFTSLEDAAFTAVSATCITGLAVKDTIMHWSGFGQFVIIAMIQVGGLGFMTITVLLSILIKRTITPRERLIIAQSLGLSRDEGTIKLVKRILFGTMLVEMSGAILLSTQFVPIFGFADGIKKGVFHSISAFCNAGFDLMGNYSGEFSSLAAFQTNPVVNITIMLLIAIGGIGFIVWSDFVAFLRTHRKFSTYSKFVIIVTLVLILSGALGTMIFEWSNPATLGNLDTGDKILASFFHSVTTRTAGFATTDNASFTESTKIISIILMFIGGSSGSTAGGVKANTIGLIVFAVFLTAIGRSEITLFKRKISTENVMRAISIVALTMILVVVAAFILMAADGVPFLSALYETVSAVATVGLSLSLTPILSTVSHITLMLLMFFGRVGILTITYSIMFRGTAGNACISYPETQMLVG